MRVPMIVAALAVSALAAPAARGAEPFTLRSTAFADGDTLPARFTCAGLSQSWSLMWTEPPAGTRSMALVVDDPDAPGGTFTHWMIWNIPPGALEVPDAVNTHKEAFGEENRGTNDFGKVGFGAPCPPPGKPHRYVTRVLALSAPLDLPANADRRAFDAALRKVKVLGTATLTATFGR